MRNLKRLKWSLNSLCKFLDENYDINSGGCCLLTYLIAVNLEKLGVKYDLIIYNDRAKNLKGITREIIKMEEEESIESSVIKGGTCTHYTLKIHRAGIINKEDYNPDHYFEYRINKINSNNIKWIYEKGFWNSYYDTANSASIQNIIKSFFEQFYEESKERT